VSSVHTGVCPRLSPSSIFLSQISIDFDSRILARTRNREPDTRSVRATGWQKFLSLVRAIFTLSRLFTIHNWRKSVRGGNASAVSRHLTAFKIPRELQRGALQTHVYKSGQARGIKERFRDARSRTRTRTNQRARCAAEGNDRTDFSKNSFQKTCLLPSSSTFCFPSGVNDAKFLTRARANRERIAQVASLSFSLFTKRPALMTGEIKYKVTTIPLASPARHREVSFDKNDVAAAGRQKRHSGHDSSL